jgi:hypothetical protein
MININEMVTAYTLNNGSQTKYGLVIMTRKIDGGMINGFVSEALYFPNKELP